MQMTTDKQDYSEQYSSGYVSTNSPLQDVFEKILLNVEQLSRNWTTTHHKKTYQYLHLRHDAN